MSGPFDGRINSVFPDLCTMDAKKSQIFLHPLYIDREKQNLSFISTWEIGYGYLDVPVVLGKVHDQGQNGPHVRLISDQ